MALLDLLTLSFIERWVVLTGIVGIAAMGVDKFVAVIDWGDRISEKTLHIIALLGGFWGIILGAFLFIRFAFSKQVPGYPQPLLLDFRLQLRFHLRYFFVRFY